ncbi:MAG: hypothetical protein ACLTAP_00180, partial [Enterococcus faecium]
MRLKHFLITGIILMVTGGLLAGATYTLGAQKSLTWDDGPRLIDICISILGIGLFMIISGISV